MDKIDKLDERLDKIELVLVRNTAILDEHQRRSTALEAHVKLLEAETRKVSKHVDGVNFAAKLVTGLLGVVIALKSLGAF